MGIAGSMFAGKNESKQGEKNDKKHEAGRGSWHDANVIVQAVGGGINLLSTVDSEVAKKALADDHAEKMARIDADKQRIAVDDKRADAEMSRAWTVPIAAAFSVTVFAGAVSFVLTKQINANSNLHKQFVKGLPLLLAAPKKEKKME